MSSSKMEPIILTKDNSNNQIIEITAYHLQDLSVYTDQSEHAARSFSASLPLVQCTLSGKQSNPLICLISLRAMGAL